MELITLYYFSELSKDLNMTRTAQRLFISQQTLSNHIARLEDYYGVRLFNRKPTLSLTPAGQAVLQFASNTSLENESLKNELSDILGQETGTLKLGGNYHRLNSFVDTRLQDYLKRYPNVYIEIRDMLTTNQQEDELLKNALDIATISRARNGREHPRLLYQETMTDEVYLCVSDRLLKEYYGAEAPLIKKRSIENGVDLRDFEKLPFYMFNNAWGRQVAECFEDVDVHPHVALRGNFSHSASHICFQGVVACFLSRLNLLESRLTLPKDLSVYRIFHEGSEIGMDICLARNRENYFPRYAAYMWDFMVAYYEGLGKIPLASTIPELF